MNAPPRAPVVAGYEVLGLLGSGGLGSVWKARTAAGASVAIKVVEPRRPVDAAVADRLFRREALAGLNLDHPGIVKALDAVKARDGRPCIVFELAEGPTLRDAVKARGAIPPQEALWIATSLAAALDHAHRHGVVHGDVSPGNVLLSPAGARLLDFGLVAELEARPGGSVFATPGFTAPEVLAGGAPTAASDLHALGKTLAFALQGADHPLRAVVDRLCRDEPSARYRSAAELGLDLDALAAGETPLGAALAGAKARMAAPRRGPWILAGTALAVVAGVLLLRDPPAARPRPLRPRRRPRSRRPTRWRGRWRPSASSSAATPWTSALPARWRRRSRRRAAPTRSSTTSTRGGGRRRRPSPPRRRRTRRRRSPRATGRRGGRRCSSGPRSSPTPRRPPRPGRRWSASTRRPAGSPPWRIATSATSKRASRPWFHRPRPPPPTSPAWTPTSRCSRRTP